jgi:imidazolonepropionase-like amidohydrolase
MPDLVVRGDTQDIAIEDGKIVAIGPDLPGAAEEIDARGLHVFPGLIDVHLHFNEPGRTDWEGAVTGSRALAAGASELDALHRQWGGVRSQARGAGRLFDHGLRALGRTDSRQSSRDGGTG